MTIRDVDDAWIERHTPGIKCGLCDARFEPMTDEYKCPECGYENEPPEYES